MNESDSFIDEVTDAVRRDRLFALMRRYGWIAILGVVVLVGGAAVIEYRKAQAEVAAQKLGDEIVAALAAAPGPTRLAALQAVPATGKAGDIVALMVAAEELTASDPAAAAQALRSLAESTTAPRIYSDLAALKLVLIGGDTLDAATRAQVLDRLAQPGAPFRALALEQKMVDLATAGQTEAAIAAGRDLMQEPNVTANLARRVNQMLVVLGADMPGGAG